MKLFYRMHFSYSFPTGMVKSENFNIYRIDV